MFVEQKTWDGIKGVDMAEVYDRVGPSIATSPRRAKNKRPEPEFLPVCPSKHIGKVTYFSVDKGFGKINKHVFFHVSDVIDGNKAFIREGVTLAYEEGVDKRNGREKAVDIQLVNV
ncbi:cold-shock protein [Paenibacillus sp. GCM10027627]|uniref:cold-shock protein n=1 Tax=unclassified Paenibacillus TaxID=185978 RepID=UPI00363A8660